MRHMYLSVIIPAYNEEERIGSTLDKIKKFLSEKDYASEIIVVDDGSGDATCREVEKRQTPSGSSIKLLKLKKNKGKGAAIKKGILTSAGEIVLFSDADLSTPIEELDRLIGNIGDRCDIVVGSRSIKEAKVMVHQPWYREGMGRIFNLFVRLILLKGIMDTQCGFKLFNGNVAREIASEMKIDEFCFDVEMLYLAHRKGYRIKEKGVSWLNSPQSKVRIVNSSLSMFLDLFRIKKLHG